MNSVKVRKPFSFLGEKSRTLDDENVFYIFQVNMIQKAI